MNPSVKFAAAAALLAGVALAAAPVHAAVVDHGTGGPGTARAAHVSGKPVPSPLPHPTVQPKPGQSKPAVPKKP